MLRNPSPSKEVTSFYKKLQSDKTKFWYDYTEYKFVLITEKPSQIRALRAVLPDGNHIRIVSLAGHIMRLKNFEEYDPSLKDKTWFKMVKDNDLPFIPDQYENRIKEPSTGRFKTDYEDMYLSLKRAANEADFVISAADPDNEGCSLMFQPVEHSGNSGKILGQINMSKLDFFSLQEEIKHFDKIPYYEMAQAGMSRSEFDWVFGLNNTILASVLLGGGQTYHIGGVKSPVMKMISDRIKHIETFKPEPYCQFHGEAKHSKTGKDFKYIVKVKKDNSEIIATKDKIEILELKIKSLTEENTDSNLYTEIDNLYKDLSKLYWKLNELTRDFESAERDIFSKIVKKKIEDAIKSGLKLKVTNFETKKGLTQNPPLAYSLTDLQAEAGFTHSFTPAKTLQLAQKLYEDQWQSYPRTDNRYYASGEMANIKKIVPNLLGLSAFSQVNVPTPYKAKTGVFNSAKVSAHTGLAPTTKPITNTSLSGEAKIIYEMVATRYLIQFMDKFEYYQVKLDANVDGEIYITTHQNIEVKKGWRELYNPSNMYGFAYVQQQTLPNMLIGDEIEILTIERDDLETKPQPMFTDFSLLKGMENIKHLYEDIDGLEQGIGTPATRAAILEQLFASKYLIRKGKTIDLSQKAKILIDLLPLDMTSPQLRANMEAKLNDIVAGKFTRKEYEHEFKKLIEQQSRQLHEISKTNKITAIDKTTLPPSEAQLKFAHQIEKELKIKIPDNALKLKDEMTKWLKMYEKKMPILLSDKQYEFLKNYGTDDEKICMILEAHDKKILTREQKFEASKWLGNFIRSSDYHKKRAAKAATTRKVNREAKMKMLGVIIPEIKLKIKK